MAAQRMADGSNAAFIYLGQRFQKIDGAHVVDDSLHRTALITACVNVSLEVGFVVTETRIVRDQRYISSQGKFMGVEEMGFPRSRRLIFPIAVV